MGVSQRMIVTGRVQGVGYRNFALSNAKALGLSGWVRNIPGGAVEILATGDDSAVDALVEVCREGPRLARVDDIRVEPAEQAGWRGFYKRFHG